MFRLEWLGLGMLVALTMWTREVPRETSSTTDEYPRNTWCRARNPASAAAFAREMENTRRTLLARADAEYRNGESGRAAATIRELPDVLWETQLQSLVQLYASFADVSATIDSPSTSTIELFVALRRAQSLDMALGGAFADRLNDLMRTVAPEAAIAYTRLHDRANADLATHTAELFK